MQRAAVTSAALQETNLNKVIRLLFLRRCGSSSLLAKHALEEAANFLSGGATAVVCTAVRAAASIAVFVPTFTLPEPQERIKRRQLLEEVVPDAVDAIPGGGFVIQAISAA